MGNLLCVLCLPACICAGGRQDIGRGWRCEDGVGERNVDLESMPWFGCVQNVEADSLMHNVGGCWYLYSDLFTLFIKLNKSYLLAPPGWPFT